MRLNVDVLRDAETGMFFTGMTNVPGLAVESESYDALLAQVEQLTPILLEANGVYSNDYGTVEISYTAHHQVTLAR